MLTGLKVSSLACKCVFYRPEHNAKGVPMEMNFEDLEMQKLKKPTDITQRVNEKMGSFVQKLWSLKCQKLLIFCFSGGDSKKISLSMDKIYTYI